MMSQEITKHIVNKIDDYILLFNQNFKEFGIDNFQNFLFQYKERSEYTINKYIHGPVFVTLPTDKREYYKLIEEITKYYLYEDYSVCADLVIDFNNLFQDSEQVSQLYGRMVFNYVIDEAIQQYLAISTNQVNIELVEQYLVTE